MNICMNDVLYALSTALDAVEHELAGASTYHAQRVAYLSIRTGRVMGLEEEELLNLGACAVLHDNALTEYIRSEERRPDKDQRAGGALDAHCLMGEKNVASMPFYKEPGVQGAILYHHERADGNGPFRKKCCETPLFARIIHLWDRVDVAFNFGMYSAGKWEKVCRYILQNKRTMFDLELADQSLYAVSEEVLQQIERDGVTDLLRESLPEIKRDYSPEEIRNISDIFAKITDYKSHFTCRHSLGMAVKAKEMGEYYGADEETAAKLYLAGALHDIGKLVVNTEILEKPGKLTAEEYKHIQNHAEATYEILSPIKGFAEITSWASLHHEKLDGSGYPFGRKADELGHYERMMACLDIYQALTEARPYKEGMEHHKAVGILRSLGEKGMLDIQIIEDIDAYYSVRKETA